MKLILPLIALILIFVITANSGCKKEHYDTAGMITYSDPAGDGCGWSVVIGSVSYHADNLADKYKIPNQLVYLSYSLTGDKYGCGFPPGAGGLPIIHISNIRKNN